ncbi:MAG TPA: FAD-binding oxidoreductase, partial [Candidatus Paceibacterota bacterium]
MNLVQELKVRVAGEVKVDDETLKKFSRDASLLEVKPQVVLAPAGVEDIKKTVRFVSESKKENPNLAITARAAGTCMSGGPLSESIVLDFLPHFQGVKSFDLAKKEVTVLAGTYYRDMEKETLKRGLILPCYTASKEINAVGGMVGNNSAGEKTLRYGKTDSYVT